MTLAGIVPVDATAWRVRWLVGRRHFLKRVKTRMRNTGSIFDDISNAVAGYGAHTRGEEHNQ